MKKFLLAALATLALATTSIPATASIPATSIITTEKAAPVAYTVETTAAAELYERVNLTGLNEGQYVKAKQAQRQATAALYEDTAKMAAEASKQAQGLIIPRPAVRPLRTSIPQRRRRIVQQEKQQPTKLAPLPLEDRD